MKILYVATGIKGHNLVYLTNLIQGRKEEDAVIIPEDVNSLDCKKYIISRPAGKERTFGQYMKWLKSINEVVKKEQPDIVHFLNGDDFYKFFGVGLEMIKKCKIVITLHWLRPRKIERISIKSFAKRADRVVVHSAYLKDQLESLGVKNAYHIEYPQFNEIKADKTEACKYWNIAPDVTTIACIGSTRYDKGIDILIRALKEVKHNFQLLVTGEADHFSKEELEKLSEGIEDKVFLNIHYLSDEELAYAFAASDIIVLPYRKLFNGASGPLGEGVSYNKCIIGSNHGNLGYTISKHHLGYTFESEDSEDLSKVIEKALSTEFVQDEIYKKYKDSLNPDIFRLSYNNMYEGLLKD